MNSDMKEDQKEREGEKEQGDAVRNILETESEKSQCHRSGRGMENKNQMGKKILQENNNERLITWKEFRKPQKDLKKNPKDSEENRTMRGERQKGQPRCDTAWDKLIDSSPVRAQCPKLKLSSLLRSQCLTVCIFFFLIFFFFFWHLCKAPCHGVFINLFS